MKKKQIKELNKLLPKGYNVKKLGEVFKSGCDGENNQWFKIHVLTEKQPTKQELLEKAERDYCIPGLVFEGVNTKGDKETVVSDNPSVSFDEVGYIVVTVLNENTPVATIYDKKVGWQPIIKKPIYKLNNKFMYEGDEYWPVYTGNKFWMEKRYVGNDCDFFLYHDKDVKLFATKQEALEFVLEEAKERFKGCRKVLFKDKEEYEINIESIKIDYWNEPKYKGNVMHVNTLKGSGVIGLNLWQEKLGWIAEPIKENELIKEKGNAILKARNIHEDSIMYINNCDTPFGVQRFFYFGYEPFVGVYLGNNPYNIDKVLTKDEWKDKKKEPKLMLGNEVVDVLKPGELSDSNFNKTGSTLVICKGESVTKEEWIKFYHSLKESWEWVKEATLQLGNYEVFFSRSDDSLHFGCVDGIENVTIEQIESITKALNEL